MKQAMAVSFWDPMIRTLESRAAERPEDDGLRALLKIGKDRAAGLLEQAAFDLEIARVRAEAILRESPPLRPFPAASPEALEYATHRASVKAYRDKLRQRARGVDVAEPVKPKALDSQALAVEGRVVFHRWYDQIHDGFQIVIDVVDELVAGGDPADVGLARNLVARGDTMQVFYRDGLRNESMPWMPPVGGSKYPTIVRAFERWRDRVSSRHPEWIVRPAVSPQDESQRSFGL